MREIQEACSSEAEHQFEAGLDADVLGSIPSGPPSLKAQPERTPISLERRTCACGCAGTFRVMPTSSQRYASDACRKLVETLNDTRDPKSKQEEAYVERCARVQVERAARANRRMAEWTEIS